VAWALAAASVLWGLALSTRLFSRSRGETVGDRGWSPPRPAWLFDLHRFLGGLALVFTGIHVLAIVIDTYTDFGLVNVLVPFTGSWHPVAVAWGVVGLYLLLAVELTSLARSRIPKTLWRRVHFASFALFALTSIHAVAAGTDARSGPLLGVILVTCLAVACLTAVRIGQALRRRELARAHGVHADRPGPRRGQSNAASGSHPVRSGSATGPERQPALAGPSLD
jgi:DMSO/TMAO reductase YedYZ heme-binding membrane subunit